MKSLYEIERKYGEDVLKFCVEVYLLVCWWCVGEMCFHGGKMFTLNLRTLLHRTEKVNTK